MSLKRMMAILRGPIPPGLPYETISKLHCELGINPGNMCVRGTVGLYKFNDEDEHYTYFDGAEPEMAAVFEKYGPLTIKQIELVLAGERDFLTQFEVSRVG